MSENRWIQEPRKGEGASVVPFPANLRLEVTYLTDPDIHAAVLPIKLGTPIDTLAQTIHAYPTMALAVQQAAAQLFPLGRATAGDLREELAAED